MDDEKWTQQTADEVILPDICIIALINTGLTYYNP